MSSSPSRLCKSLIRCRGLFPLLIWVVETDFNFALSQDAAVTGSNIERTTVEKQTVEMPTVDALEGQLQSESVTTRRTAATAVLKSGHHQQLALLPFLVTCLKKEPDGQVRLMVIETITRLGNEADTAVPVLLEAMSAERDGSRAEKLHQDYRTAVALAAIGAPSVEGLRTLLASKKETIRAEAAMALGRIGPSALSATDELIALLDDTNPRVTQEAAIALGRLGPSPSNALLRKMEQTPSAAVKSRVLESFGQMQHLIPDVQGAIVKATDDSDPTVQAAAIKIVEKCELSDDELGGILLKGMVQSEEGVRLAAVNVLMARKDLIQNRKTEFANLLRSSDQGVARHAAFVIAKLGQQSAPILMESLTGDKTRVEIVGDAIGGLGPGIQPWLLEQMGHSNPQVRQAAARALGQVRPANPSGIETLRRGLSDEDRLVQTACLMALGALGPRAELARNSIRDKLSDPAEESRLQAAEVLFALSHSEQNLDDFIGLLDDRSENVQLKAIQILRAIGPIGRKAMLPIIGKLSASNPEIRLAATDYLRSHGPFAAQALSSLIQMLDDSSPAMRLASAKTISQLRAEAMPAFDRLAALLKDDDSAVRIAALVAMSATGADFSQLQRHLSAALNGDDAALQTESLRLIGRMGRPAAPLIPQIIALAEKEDKRKAVERILRNFQRSGPLEESIPTLIELVNHKETAVRKLAIEFLGLAGPAANSAIPVLERLKDDPDKSLQESATTALQKIKAG